MTGRVLVLGFELGDGRLFRRFAAEGVMPTVAGLMERGRWRNLESPAGILHVAAWPSLYTGRDPGEHGVYFTFQPRPGVQGWRRFEPGIYGCPTFWSRLDAAGLRTIVLDPPYCHPETGFGGRAVFDWGCWARYLDGASAPQGLLRELQRAVGRYPLPWEAHALGLRPLEPAEVERELVAAIPARVKAVSWLAGQGEWDLLFAVFGETHVAGHYLFGEEDRLRRVHAALDRAIAELVELAGPEAAVVLISADATMPNRTACHMMPEILARLGLYASAEHGRAEQESPKGERGEEAAPRFDPVKALRDMLPEDLRKRIADFLPRALRDRLAQRVDTASVDWSRTRAFPLPSDLEGLVRVNLAGREPEGVVAEGPELESLLDELEEALTALEDVDTGQPAVARILRTDRVYPGPRRAFLPDLVVLWNDAATLRALRSTRLGEIALPSPDPRPGTHAVPGFALITGTGSEGGAEGGRVHDLAPSLLARFGVDPADLPGRVWPELLRPGEQS